MLKLIIKIALALAAVGAAAFAIHTFVSLDGKTVVEFFASDARDEGTRITLLSKHFFLLSLFVVWLTWFLTRLAHKGFGGVFAVFDFFKSRKRTRGLEALAQSMIALAERDGARAMRQAAKAERLLDNPDLTRLVNAQAARLIGDEHRAERYYEAMTTDGDTEFLGHQGLLRQALEKKTPERALKLAQRAHQLRPKDPETIDVLFDLQRKKGDWQGARDTLGAAVAAKRVTRDVAARRRAVLHVAEAMEFERAGATAEALVQARAAVRLAPGLAPAAVLAARLLAADGDLRGAQKTLIAAWRSEPHPDVAAAFAALAPDETPLDRLRRFEKLFAAAPRHAESRQLKAEIALSADRLAIAREALGELTEARPAGEDGAEAPAAPTSARALALRAAIEQEDGADEATVRGWLARAAVAPRGAQWVCDNCGAVHKRWSASCPRCDAFDSLDWTLAPAEAAATPEVPLSLLTAPRRAAATEDAVTDVVTDAVTAAAPAAAVATAAAAVPARVVRAEPTPPRSTRPAPTPPRPNPPRATRSDAPRAAMNGAAHPARPEGGEVIEDAVATTIPPAPARPAAPPSAGPSIEGSARPAGGPEAAAEAAPRVRSNLSHLPALRRANGAPTDDERA